MSKTALELLERARKARGIPRDPARLSRWDFQLAGHTISLPNFDWRKSAIDAHDLHHLILGEPFTLAGECQVATWEFAAGAFPDLRAQIFCLPLVVLGAITAPAKSWNSFRMGCKQKSLFGKTVDRLATLEQLSAQVKINELDSELSSPRLVLQYLSLIAKSFSVFLVLSLIVRSVTGLILKLA
jgi:hypothetical protein